MIKFKTIYNEKSLENILSFAAVLHKFSTTVDT